MAQPVSCVVSKPSSAPLIPGPRPTAPVAATVVVQTTPLLARSISAADSLGPDSCTGTQNYVPQSYKNAIIGGSTSCSSAHIRSGVNTSPAYSHQPAFVSAPMYLPQTSAARKPSFPFGMATPDVQNRPQWMESSQSRDITSLLSDMRNLDLYNSVRGGNREHLTDGHQTQGLLADEFPHLDIINDLLDDEHVPQVLSRQYSYPGELAMPGEMGASSSCRFERTRSYPNEGFQQSYSPGRHFESLVPQATPPIHWQVAGSDVSLVGVRNVEGDGYPYYNPGYSNLACGVSNYTTLFRPSNGH